MINIEIPKFPEDFHKFKIGSKLTNDEINKYIQQGMDFLIKDAPEENCWSVIHNGNIVIVAKITEEDFINFDVYVGNKNGLYAGGTYI